MSIELPLLEDFNAKQNGIYDGFMAKQAGIAANGVKVDAGGTELQSGYLVAFRPPEDVASEIADFSGRLAEAVPSVRYGLNRAAGLDNAHITLSDLGVQKGGTLPYNRDPATTEHVLRELGLAVWLGVRNAGGSEALTAMRVRMDGAYHNGSVAIIPGQANEAAYDVRGRVLEAAHRRGVHELSEKGFNGAWGFHSTISRVLQEFGPDSDEARQLLAVMADAPRFGNVALASIDTGYFNTDPANGFVFTPVERFEVPGNAATNISMHTPQTK